MVSKLELSCDFLARAWLMSPKLGASCFCAIVVCTIAYAGCAAKKPIASNATAFRLQASHNDFLLLSPAIPDSHPFGAPVRLTLSGRVQSSLRSDCVASRGPFRIEPGKDAAASIEISLPSPDRWLSDLEGKDEPDSNVEMEALDAFLVDVDRLQQDGCFAGAGVSVRDFVLQNVPMRPQEGYYNAYGYRLGRRGMDLKRGVRVRIERAYFRPADAGEDPYGAKYFLGLSSVYFDAESDNDNNTLFRQVGNIQYSTGSLNQVSAKEVQGDLALGSLPPEHRYRLFFYSYFVADKRRRSAAIIGSGDVGQPEALDQEFQANPEKSCNDIDGSTGAICLAFDGFVTLSTQIRLELNGNTTFAEWGVRVKDVLPKTLGSRKSIRVQRRFAADRYYDVRFDPKESTILSLVLVGGDRVTWSKRHSSNDSR
jgi:hypothetical protein